MDLSGTKWYLCDYSSSYDSSYVPRPRWASNEYLEFTNGKMYWNNRNGGTTNTTYTYSADGSEYKIKGEWDSKYYEKFTIMKRTYSFLILKFDYIDDYNGSFASYRYYEPDALPVTKRYSNDISDFTELYVDSSCDYKFTVQEGYRLQFRFVDSSNDSYASICSEEGASCGSASFVVYKSDGTVWFNGTGEKDLYSSSEVAGTCSLRITPTSSGLVAVRVFLVPIPEKIKESVNIYSSEGYSSSDFTWNYLTESEEAFYYKLYMSVGKKYYFQWIDENTVSSTDVSMEKKYSDSLSKGVYTIYNSENQRCGSNVSNYEYEFLYFEPDDSGEYIFSVQKNYGGGSNGYVGWRVFIE